MGYEAFIFIGLASIFALLYVFQDFGENYKTYILKATYFIFMLGFGLAAIVFNYNVASSTCTLSGSTWTCAYAYSNAATPLGGMVALYFVSMMVLVGLQVIYLYFWSREALNRVMDVAKGDRRVPKAFSRKWGPDE